jgi:predicted AAA+ superfamily ATPase
LENAVFGELYRRYGEEMYFLKNGVETDFVLPHKENLVMQVCYDVHSQDYEREID